jgi:glycosyltransferase involved in cell wall biosynthesis
MDEKLVTVIMPVYNAIRFLPSAVNSILNQTEQNFRMVIIDDGSADGSADYLKSIRYDKIQVYFPGRQGLIKTLNFGLSLVDTPYTAIMDADDISHPLRFEKELEILLGNKEISIVGTSAEYIGDNDNGRSIKVKMPVSDLEIKNGLKRRKFVIVHSTIMVRSSLFEKLKGYSEKSFPNPDYDLFLRAASVGKFANIQDLFCKIRFHEMSHTFKMFPQIITNLSESIEVTNISSRLSFFRKLKELKIGIIKLSVGIYRMGVLNYVNDKIVKGILLIFFSGIINPFRGLDFLRKKIELRSNQD